MCIVMQRFRNLKAVNAEVSKLKDLLSRHLGVNVDFIDLTRKYHFETDSYVVARNASGEIMGFMAYYIQTVKNAKVLTVDCMCFDCDCDVATLIDLMYLISETLCEELDVTDAAYIPRDETTATMQKALLEFGYVKIAEGYVQDLGHMAEGSVGELSLGY